MPDAVVLDASALVEAVLGTETGMRVRSRMRGHSLHAPAHLDAEVFSALGRLFRSGAVSERIVSRSLSDLVAAPIVRRPVVDLLDGAWGARDRFRLVDGLYVELARLLDLPLLTTDRRLARASPLAELIET